MGCGYAALTGCLTVISVEVNLVEAVTVSVPLSNGVNGELNPVEL